MATLAVGEIVLVPFPFSDLSQSKVRPVVCLADAGRGDCVLCQITSNHYGDPFGGAPGRGGLRDRRIECCQLRTPRETFHRRRRADRPLGRRAFSDSFCACLVRRR